MGQFVHRRIRPGSRAIACVLAVLLAFAQAAIASQACLLAASGEMSTAAAAPDCGSAPMADDGCAVHCLSSTQTTAPDQSVHVLPALPAMNRVHADFAMFRPIVTPRAAPAAPAGPPLQILYCSYQT